MSNMKIVDGWVRLHFKFDPDTIAKIKQIAYDYGVRGAWVPEEKYWRLPQHLTPVAARELPGMGRCELSEVMVQDYLRTVARRRKAYDGTPPHVTLDGRKLYDHQQDAVRQLTRSSTVLAHDMGLGKTLTSLMAARHMLDRGAADRVIIIAPVNLHKDWAKEIEATGLTKVAQVYSWAKIPKPHKDIPDHDFVLIADEAHYAQSMDSQRTKSLLELAMNYHCIACWCLTGTPMRNGRPVNLYPLLLAVDCQIARNRRRFEKRYCGAKETRFTKWDTNGASNLEELRERTSKWVIRKRTDECLDLPEKIRIIHQCEISVHTKDHYWSVFDHVYSKFLENVEIDVAIYEDEHPEAEDAEVSQFRRKKLKAKAVAQLNAIRQAASQCKIDEAIVLATDAIDEGRNVVVFAEFQKTVIDLAARYNKSEDVRPVTYHGGMTQSARDKNYQAWKAGRANLFVATPDSGGLGLNLQEGSVVIMLDRPYSPGDVEQAEKRCHRIGTNWPVTVYWLQGFPVDTVVDEMLLDKTGNIETVIEGGKLSEWDVLRRLFESAAVDQE